MFEGNVRILAFIERKGGVAKVARAIGKHPTLFYNIERKGVIPNLETLSLIKDKFPDFDLNWVAIGEVQENGLTRIKIEPTELEKKCKQLETENTLLKEYNNELKMEKNKLFDLLGKDEGEIDAYLVDEEIGYQMMNLITIIQHGGFALDERKN